MTVEPSMEVHANQADEVFLRVGDKSKKLSFEGTILRMIQECIEYLNTQIKEKTYLGMDGLFVTEEEYPKFVRQEIIVNAVTHRAYSIKGTDIHVKMFDNRIVVESPGKLPGLVRTDNIRYTHFSRNPKIAEYLKSYDFVKEYGEGVNRMFNELESAGFRVPEYCCNAFILQTVIYNKEYQKSVIEVEKMVIGTENSVIEIDKRASDDQKISVNKVMAAISEKKYNEPTKKNVLAVYEAMDVNQVFGAGDVRNILRCSLSTAGAVMAKLRELEIVVGVSGKGKGKCRFMRAGECRKKQRLKIMNTYIKAMENKKE